MAQKVMIIPATINRATSAPIDTPIKRKVAGYARVSTDQEEQQTSYETQVSYYTGYIKSRSDWEFVSVYTDEGLSGTSTKHREGFQKMVADALNGKIDLIITKSVSRFARNTVDSLTTIRRLKDHGTEVFFEKENIWTFDSKGELLLTIMSSLAQEESRSISENIRWGQHKKSATGKFSLTYSHFLGYDKGPDGGLVVNPGQAAIVRRIFGEFLAGKSVFRIGKDLTEAGIPTPSGKTVWCCSTIRGVLSNETYKGDKLLQKTYSTDFLDKTRRKNEGQVPQVYVKECHEAIIPPETFDRVQAEIERRKKGHATGSTIFSGKIFCGECGQIYGPKVWHSNDPKYRKTIWQCNSKFKDKTRCKTPHLTEDEIKAAFITALNKVLPIRGEVIANLKDVQSSLGSIEHLEAEAERLTEELAAIADIVQQTIDENTRIAQNQDDYQRRYDEQADRYRKTEDELKKVLEAIRAQNERSRRISEFISEVEAMPETVTEFSPDCWGHLVDRVTVYSKDRITFTFTTGMEV